jgi:primosomal protein N' (replication factor Y)
MTYHRDINRNICHYCNYQSVPVSVCAYCGSKHLQLLGSGTQKVEEEIHNLFPRARIARLDMDSSRKKEAQKKILQHMREGGIDILVGTQMVAKGLDFPDVSLVGIIDADSILNLPDFRASERCFQLLVQAAGRAGRRNKSGQVIIQTFNPDAQVLQMAARQDYINFYEQEIKLRQTLNYPPFTHILRMVFSSGSERQTRQASCYAADWLEELLDAREDDIMMLGPAPCPISKIRNRFRHQILLKSGSLLLLQSVAGHIIKEFGDKDIKMDIDINPLITM